MAVFSLPLMKSLTSKHSYLVFQIHHLPQTQNTSQNKVSAREDTHIVVRIPILTISQALRALDNIESVYSRIILNCLGPMVKQWICPIFALI
jgi:hypothetical protein